MPDALTSLRRRLRARAVAVLTAAALLTAALAGCGSTSGARLPPVQPARVGPQAMFTSASEILYNPAGTIATLKQLGVDRVHVPLYWDAVAPDPSSPHRPSFNAEDPAGYAPAPAAYPTLGWSMYDAVVKDLRAAHIGLDLALTSPPPRWAEGRGAPKPATQPEWKPSASEFGQFVHAVAVRYSGHYTPPGAAAPLPRVDFWSIWNEPNLGINIAPEAIAHSQVEVAPRYYRALVDAAWRSFGETGHRHDTVLIGEMAPAGIRTGTVGNFNNMPPLRFLRALYCVDGSYRRLTGKAATERGCPATAAQSAHFAAAHPGLFHATGFADHPYLFTGGPPNQPPPDEPDYAVLPDIGNLEAALDRMQRAYGSTTRFPIWDTEFGYQTKPPDPEPGTVSPTTAAAYMNWAEYLTWLDPRLQSYDQYLLLDPGPPYAFATGLESDKGVPKPGFYAYRMPLYLPVTSTASGHPLDVWGCVRPAPDAARSTHRQQSVQIQFRSGAAKAWRTVKTVPITDRHGYFEVRQTFPGSGQVRLAWSYPKGPQVFSRTVLITLR